MDCANRSALAELAFRNQIGKEQICIVEGKYDDLPEQAFYMVGTIEEAVEKAKKMK